MSDDLLLVDLSGIVHMLWHVSQSEPDPDATSTKSVDRVRQLAANYPTAAICCDSPKSVRRDLDPTYKANRPAQDAALKHQVRLTKERLKADGFPLWAVDGYEADDVIATAVKRALAIDGVNVLIVSSDKDLLQLVGPRVKCKSLVSGEVYDEAGVLAKFGVKPEQVRDYLSLVGDTSDNIVGAKGIGPKRASELLALHGTLDALYEGLDAGDAKFTPSVLASLLAFRERMPTVRALVTLHDDLAIPFEEVAAERQATEVTPQMSETEVIETDQVAPTQAAQIAGVGTEPVIAPLAQNATRALAPVVESAPAPLEWEKQLEPRNFPQAMAVASAMHRARLFNGYGSEEAVLSTILAGRELGLPAIASLRGMHIVEGRHALAADAIRALVLRSGLVKFFRCVERTDERATFEAQRHDDPQPTRLTFTVEEARRAGLVKEKGAWTKYPADLCVARASSKLARLIAPEVVFGLYAPEELD